MKSAPELWAECSDAGSLARHLGAFGEIRITKLEPETAVAWEGTAASGTVVLETAGWGTRVTLTLVEEESAKATAEAEAETVAPVAEAAPALAGPTAPAPAESADDRPEPEAESVADLELATEPESDVDTAPESPAPRPGFFARLFGRFRAAPEVTIEPDATSADPIDEAPETPAPPAPAPALVARSPQDAAPVVEAEDGSAPTGELALAAALDSLGRAHHRPFSRA